MMLNGVCLCTVLVSIEWTTGNRQVVHWLVQGSCMNFFEYATYGWGNMFHKTLLFQMPRTPSWNPWSPKQRTRHYYLIVEFDKHQNWYKILLKTSCKVIMTVHVLFKIDIKSRSHIYEINLQLRHGIKPDYSSYML